MMPDVVWNGLHKDRRMTSGEATLILRDLLCQGGIPLDRVRLLSSHSLKATVLAWAARRGLPMEVRRLLGHHHGPAEESVVAYSRDAMYHPLQLLRQLIDDINSGAFDPDSRSCGRPAFVSESCTGPVVGSDSKHEREPIGLNDKGESDHGTGSPDIEAGPPRERSPSSCSSSTSGSTSSANSASSGPSCEADALDMARLRPALVPSVPLIPHRRIFQHQASSVVHMAGTTASRLKCGRQFHGGYRRVEAAATALWPTCKQCFHSDA